MDKLQWKELILQWVIGHEFTFNVSVEGIEDDNYFLLTLSKEEVLSLVINRFKDTDIFEGVTNVPYDIDGEIKKNLALIADKYPGESLEITLSTLENYLKSWKYLYENFDEEFFEANRHCYDKWFHDSSFFYQELKDFEGEFFMWDVVEGDSVTRTVKYYQGDHLIELSCYVWEELLRVRISDFNMAGGDARKVEVKDVKKLMSILGVDRIEDVLDALMNRCESNESPLDKNMFYQFLKDNGLEYDEEIVGAYDTEWDEDGDPKVVYHPKGE